MQANWAEAIYWLYQDDDFTPTARYEKGRLHYTVSDQVGTITELLTEDGYIDYRQKLNLWGEAEIDGHRHYAANDSNPLKCNHRFVGQYYDDESELHYNRFRYYSPETGQYISHDPIGLLGGFNPYGYVGIPTAFVDPLGLAVCGRDANQPGRSGNTKIDRAAEELNAYVQRASKMADKGIHMNTAWGKIYSSWKNNQYIPQWLKNVAKGNAVQQITDRLAFNPNNPNRYLTELAQLGGYSSGIPRNVSGIWAPLRPDYHFRLPDGNGGYRYGVFDITTPGQAPKIGKYSNEYTDWFINIIY
ncbi:RHS repeat-associated core domain-containing protein [Aggregatibacter actinomycetemcomitans]|nr:RHS repeat-associated core domain-containing protein [Aggregatibacter actinomycetemcomitans]